MDPEQQATRAPVEQPAASAPAQTPAPAPAPTPTPAPAPVSLYAEDGPAWKRVSERLIPARTVAVSIAAAPFALVAVALALLTGARWILWFLAPVCVGYVWAVWLIRRQVPAISYAEQAEELVIRKGRMWRTLVSVPYGRLQLADMQSGPLARHFGIATVELHTAAPGSSASIPGLPIAEAEALRERLTARGESQRAGL